MKKIFCVLGSIFVLCGLSFAQVKSKPLSQTHHVQSQEWSFIHRQFKVYDAQGNLFDGKTLSGRDMIAIALSYSLIGPEHNDWKRSFVKYDELLAKVQSAMNNSVSDYQLAETILDIMHTDCLTEYGLHEDYINRTFVMGRYNCVTSTVLYVALCKETGIDARGQLVPGHIFPTVYVDGKAVDVECTNAAGFDPGTPKKRIKNGKTYTTTVPKPKYQWRRECSDRVTVSRMATNKSSSFNNKDEYDWAIPMFNAAINLIEDPAEREFEKPVLDQLYVNYAIKLSRAGRVDSSVMFLEDVMERFGSNKYLLKEYSDFCYNSMVEDYNSKKFVTAQKKLDERAKYLSKADYDRYSNEIKKGRIYEIHNRVADLVKAKKYEEAYMLLKDRMSQFPDEKVLLNDLKLLEPYVNK